MTASVSVATHDAIVGELEAHRAMLGSRAALLAGRIAELESSLAATQAEVEAQRLRADTAEQRLAAYPPPVDGDPLAR